MNATGRERRIATIILDYDLVARVIAPIAFDGDDLVEPLHDLLDAGRHWLQEDETGDRSCRHGTDTLNFDPVYGTKTTENLFALGMYRDAQSLRFSCNVESYREGLPCQPFKSRNSSTDFSLA